VQEKFIGFVKLQRVRANDIANAIITTLEDLKLSLMHLQGQGYDGAANMRGQKSGVQNLMCDQQPKAMYTHCAGPSLNLAIVASCSILPMQHCISQVKSMTH